MPNINIDFLLGNLLLPIVVGFVIWLLGKWDLDKRIKSESIRDLITFRGDFTSQDFRRSLNKISIVFHNNKEVRGEIRSLYEAINTENISEQIVNRKIVGLIYNLCQKNGFGGITEYDIDQSFPESKQTPIPLETMYKKESEESIKQNVRRQKKKLKK